MPDFRIEEAARDEAVELTLGGDLDMSATFVLEPVIDRVMGERPRALVLDLADVAFVDSSGVGLLIATHERADRADVPMEISGASREVQRVFKIAGLDGILPVRDDQD